MSPKLLALLALALAVPVARAAHQATNELLVYMPGVHKLVALFASNGSLAWSYTGPDPLATSLAAAPSLVNDVLYICDYFTVRALQPRTGQELWNWTLGPPHRLDDVTPAVSANLGILYFGDETGEFHCLNATTGAYLWAVVLPMGVWVTAAVASDGSAFIGGEGDNFIRKFHPNGTQLWQVDIHQPLSATPTFNHNESTIYAVAGCSRVCAIDAKTGEKLWNISFNLPQGACAGPEATVGPDGTIYFGYGDSGLHAVTPTGKPLWQVPIGVGCGLVTSATVSTLDGTIYGGACEQINAVDVNGTVKWSYTHPNPEPQPWESQPAAIDQRGIVYFPTAGTVAALDPASGKVAWNYTMDTAYYGGGIVGCNCPPPFSLSRCAVACQLQG